MLPRSPSILFFLWLLGILSFKLHFQSVPQPQYLQVLAPALRASQSHFYCILPFPFVHHPPDKADLRENWMASRTPCGNQESRLQELLCLWVTSSAIGWPLWDCQASESSPCLTYRFFRRDVPDARELSPLHLCITMSVSISSSPTNSTSEPLSAGWSLLVPWKDSR